MLQAPVESESVKQYPVLYKFTQSEYMAKVCFYN